MSLMESTMLYLIICVHMVSLNLLMSRLENNLSYNCEDSQGYILDVILSSDPLSINVDRMLAPIGSSDHSQFEFSIFFPFSDNSSTELPPAC